MPLDASTFLDAAKIITMTLIGVSFFASMVRVVLGPSTADRVVAMDMISMLVIGFVSVYCIEIESEVYLNATIILALVSFLSVIAIARYVERPQQESLDEVPEEGADSEDENAPVETEVEPEEEGSDE